LRPPIDGHQLAGIVAVRDSMAVEILRRLKARPDAVRSVLADRWAWTRSDWTQRAAGADDYSPPRADAHSLNQSAPR